MRWKIDDSFLNRYYNILHRLFPFKLLYPNKQTIESIAFQEEYLKDYSFPVEDVLTHRFLSISQIIPTEKIKPFNNKYSYFYSRKIKNKFPIVDDRDGFFNKMAVYGGSWINLGFGELTAPDVFKTFSAHALRISESFIQVTFHFGLSDEVKYKFYNMLRKNYNTKVSLINPNFPLLLRRQSIQIFGPDFVLFDAFYTYLLELRKTAIQFLSKNKLIFHISSKDSISIFNLFSFKYISRKNNKFYTFWDSLSIPDDGGFIDKKKQFYFPDMLNHSSDVSEICNLIFFNEETFSSSDYLRTMNQKLSYTLSNLDPDIIQAYTINNLLKDLYQQIVHFRINYFTSINRKRYLRRFHRFKKMKYWIELFSSEYLSLPDTHKDKLELSRSLFYKEEYLLDKIKQSIRIKVNSLRSLSHFLDNQIGEFSNILLIKQNTRIQRSILFLTGLTVLIGVYQSSYFSSLFIDFIHALTRFIASYI